MDTTNFTESGRIERLLGKYFRSDYHSNPLKVIFWVMLFAYVPVFIITALEGHLYKGQVDIPFLLDYKAQFRALVAIPLLIMARKMVREKLLQTNEYIAHTLLDEAQYKNVISPAIAKIKRLNNKGYDELVIFLVIILFSILIGRYDISKAGILHRGNWMGHMENGDIRLTDAAKWQLFVSINIYRFIIVRWIWMYGCWIWVLIKVSKCRLKLSYHHADKVCGLNLLVLPQRAFNMFFVALAVIAAGNLINQIIYFDESIAAVKMEIGITIGASFIFLLFPYFSFMGTLIKARNEAEIWMSNKSAALSNTYQEQFIKNNNKEAIDPSVMADFNATYEIMMKIKPVPFSLRDVIGLAVPIALAFVPTLLSFMTVKELLDIVLGFVT